MQTHETKSSLETRALVRFTPDGTDPQRGFPAVILDPMQQTANVFQLRALDADGVAFFIEALTAAKARMVRLTEATTTT